MKKIYLIVECATFFGLLPMFYILGLLRVHILVLLFIVTILCVAYLFSDDNFDRTRLWNLNIFRAQFKRILGIFFVNVLIMTTVIWVFKKDLFFSFIREKPLVWLTVMILYPLLSVYPQEVLYRTFFFHRYASIFPGRLYMISASAIAFAWVHIVFENMIAVILTLAGGLIFANTYDETKSTFAVVFEHSLYGCFLFTIGLGKYFYYSAIV